MLALRGLLWTILFPGMIAGYIPWRWFGVSHVRPAANLFVMLYEEPALRRQFGESYERYAKQVGRWIP